MSGREWQPGDVAMAIPRKQIHGGPLPFVRYDTGCERGWMPCVGPMAHVGDDALTDIRPLVVIDPEDREQVKRLTASYARECGYDPDNEERVTVMQAALRSLVAPELEDDDSDDFESAMDSGDFGTMLGALVNEVRRLREHQCGGPAA